MKSIFELETVVKEGVREFKDSDIVGVDKVRAEVEIKAAAVEAEVMAIEVVKAVLNGEIGLKVAGAHASKERLDPCGTVVVAMVVRSKKTVALECAISQV